MKFFCAVWIVLAAARGFSAEETGFIELFNGRDLTGWTNVNCAPNTWSVQDGVIHCTGRPIGALRSAKQYENFVLEAEWRHLKKGGNAGMFIWASPIAAPGVPFLRAIEVQVLDNDYEESGKNQWYTTHGDVFPIHGSTMKPFGRHNGQRSFPSEERSKSSPEWNAYRIVCRNGVLRLSVNGKEVSGGEDCIYRKGYVGLESEGSPVEFRNIRIKELPSSAAGTLAPEMIAPADKGWRSLFTGLDFSGWKTNSNTAEHWAVAGEHIISKGVVAAEPDASKKNDLETQADFGDSEFVIDCRTKEGAKEGSSPILTIRGTKIELAGGEAGKWSRFTINLRDNIVRITRDNGAPRQLTLDSNSPARGPLTFMDSTTKPEFMNIYVRDL